ncbi:54S ribosomal protein L6, mitochondrial [Cladophialophora carrionii]|uniref:Large ribosomal subunit protein uL6m n=1 Tax=Cladophialophora carrionii TaxID=86049 RepID=A0A1C1CXK4_9EURO|nr:54S ribosomal protein L6, mitochondrial [Cladophialophora carrionii]
MSCINHLHSPLRRLVREATCSATRDLPAFLVPAITTALLKPRGARPASTLAHTHTPAAPTAPSHQSRIGRTPINVPPEVQLRFYDLPKGNVRSRHPDTPNMAVEVTGPLGQLTVPLPPYLHAQHDEAARKISVRVDDVAEKHQRAMWGTMRALLQNSISGVSEGHLSILRLVGVGYRATIEPTATTVAATYPGQQFVNLKLGYAHPVELGVPKGVTASTPQPTRILLQGVDRQVVKQFAAQIRMWRKPEPYKGKGIFVDGETIRLKAKKIK